MDGDSGDEEATILDPDRSIGPGSDVGGYLIDGELGRGGMGVVYSAMHPVIGKRAAIKILKPEVSKSQTTIERFIQEARAVNQIGHPNIIDIFAFGKTSDGRAYHIMDLLVGEPLRARLKRGPLHPSEAASVIEEIASALTAAHDKGFVHRDLKPDNVYLVKHDGRWPEVKLLDFGLCKLMPDSGMQAPFRTKTGLMLGTPEYMSPEQARGRSVDYRTDIYALGVLTFEILTGRRPFPSRKTPFETLQAHATDPPPSLKLLLPHLPDDLIQLVEAMLAKSPDDRPTIAAVRTVIKRLRSTQLPSHTMAGMEMAAIQQQSNPGIVVPLPTAMDSLGGVGPSQLGASPMVAPSQPPQRPSNPSNPPFVPVASTRPSQPPPMAAQGAPVTSAPQTQLSSRYGSINPVTDPGVRPGTGTDPAPSGLRAGMAPMAPTTLGIGANAVRAAVQQAAMAAQPKPLEKLNLLYLVIGALVAIGLGVGVALALVD